MDIENSLEKKKAPVGAFFFYRDCYINLLFI
jgi:hypothetical protein